LTLPLIKPGGWAPNSKLTSDEINAFQANLIKAIDGVNGGTVTLLAALILAGSDVRIANILRVLTGAQLIVDSGGTLSIPVGAIQSLAGALNVLSGGAINIQGGADINVAATGEVNLATGATLKVDGILTVPGGGQVHLTGQTTLHGGADLDLVDTSAIHLATGTAINANSGSNVNINGTAQLNVASTAIAEIATADRLTIAAAPFSFRLSGTPLFAATGWAATSEGNWDMVADGGQLLTFALPLHVGDTLQTLTMRLAGAGMGNGGHVGIPTDRPEIQFFRKDVNGVIPTPTTQIDGSANVAAYDAAHDVTLSFGPGLLIGNTQTYYVRIRAEGPTGSLANRTRVYAITGTGLGRSFRGSNEIYT